MYVFLKKIIAIYNLLPFLSIYLNLNLNFELGQNYFVKECLPSTCILKKKQRHALDTNFPFKCIMSALICELKW